MHFFDFNKLEYVVVKTTGKVKKDEQNASEKTDLTWCYLTPYALITQALPKNNCKGKWPSS